MPDGFDFLICREFSECRRGLGTLDRSLFIGGQLHRHLLLAGEAEHEACNLILLIRRQATRSFNSLFKQFGHDPIISEAPAQRKEVLACQPSCCWWFGIQVLEQRPWCL
jgi:hypothetical protein